MRRTYISIALVANNFDVKWVMAQVGHADSKMTMDVYAQLEQRADRSHGTQFDALLRGAKHRLEGVDWATIGPRDRNSADEPSSGDKEKAPQKAALCRHFSDGETRTRTGDTTIFSRVLYQLSYLAAADQSSRGEPAAHACSCGSGSIGTEALDEYQPSGQISKWRWGPLEEPVLPHQPELPARRRAPGPSATETEPLTRCMKT